MYASAARGVLKAPTAAGKAVEIDGLLQKLRDRKPTYAEFEAAFVQLRSSRLYTQQAPLVRYVLERLHATAPGATATAPIAMDQLTVEHLVPQGSKRPTSVPHSEVARIGNLILVTEKLNNDLEDKPFSEKHKTLKAVPGVEKMIVSAKQWGVDEIFERSQEMAKRAFDDVWNF